MNAVIARERRRRGNLITILQEAQKLLGYLSRETLVTIAAKLKLSPSQVYGVATFYTQFRLAPVGKNIIKVCHGTACHVAGAEKITSALERHLGIRAGETTADGAFTLEQVACLGCCSLSPVIMINETVHGKLAPARIPSLLKKYG